MDEKIINLVLMTSMIRPVRDATSFSAVERITQTLFTIKCIREKIPNSYIVMIEGGDLQQDEIDKFKSLVDCLFFVDVKYLTKSPGEATLLHTYLTSENFNNLKREECIQTISKLSGRYYLTKNFDWSKFPLNKTIINYIANGWQGKPLYTTRYYRLPINHLQQFITGLSDYIGSEDFRRSTPDIEHHFFKYNAINFNEMYNPKTIGVAGQITNTKQIVED